MPSIEANRTAGEAAKAAGRLVKPPIPAVPAPPGPSLNPYPAPNSYIRTPLPAIATQQPDQQRAFQTGTVPQDRLIPIGNVPAASAQVAGNALANAFTQTGPIQVQVNENTTDISSNTSAIASLQSTGFQGDWSAAIIYQQGASVVASDSKIYISLIDGNFGNDPTTSPSDWAATGASETYAGIWNSGTAYTIGLTVSVSSQLFIALQNNTNKNPTNTNGFWQLLNASAVAAWNSATAYLANNLVSFNGNIYAALNANTNAEPDTNPSNWTVFSVNPATGSVAATGSIPLTQNTGLSYTATTTSIDLIWEALALYRSDNTITTIGTSSQNVTALGSGRTFFAYPYYDEIAQTFNFVSNSQVSFPTLKGIAYTNAGNEYATTTTSAALPAAFTFSTWVQVASGYAGSGGATVNTSHTTTPLSSINSVFNFEWNGGSITAGYRDSGGTFHTLTSAQTYNDGEFHHVCYVCSPATSSQILYVDGVSAATGSVATAVSATSGFWWLNRGASNITMTGTLTEVSFFNSALSATNVMAIYNAGNSISQSALETVITSFAPTIWWKSTDAGPTSIADSGSIGGNTGTAVNSPTFGTTAAVFGAIGSPAILWPSRSLLVSQAQSIVSRVPFTSGGWAVATPSVGTASGTNSGSSGGSGNGGCFTANVRIRTSTGDKRFDELQAGDLVFDRNNQPRKILNVLKHDPSSHVLHDMGDGELITLQHVVFKNGEWMLAGKAFVLNLVQYDGPIYNLSVEGDSFDSHSFQLANGVVAHNASFS